MWQLYVVIFIVTSESKRPPETDFVMEDMKQNILAIFVSLASHFLIESKSRKRLEYSKL